MNDTTDECAGILVLRGLTTPPAVCVRCGATRYDRCDDARAERQARLQTLHSAGMSYAAIGRQENLTRERVRQILSGQSKPKPAPKTRIAECRAAAFARLDGLGAGAVNLSALRS